MRFDLKRNFTVAGLSGGTSIIPGLPTNYYVAKGRIASDTLDKSFEKIRKLCDIHKEKYNFYINRKRLKAMMEVIFFRKDCDESWNI